MDGFRVVAFTMYADIIWQTSWLRSNHCLKARKHGQARNLDFSPVLSAGSMYSCDAYLGGIIIDKMGVSLQVSWPLPS
jgi:hypothetical protein